MMKNLFEIFLFSFFISFFQTSSFSLAKEFSTTDFPVQEIQLFSGETQFWKNIYTLYNSHSFVIHDEESPEIVFSIINLEMITHQSNIIQKIIQDKTAEQHLNKLKTRILNYHFLNESINLEDRNLYKILKEKYNPKNKKQLSAIANRLRKQRGQANYVQEGLERITPYLNFLHTSANHLNVPADLMAISLLESSFNINAVSKVDARGLWQFMQQTYRLITGQNPNSFIDYRNSIEISSLMAFQLLKSNYQLLKNWPMAIASYNSGTSFYLKSKKILIQSGNKNPTLFDILKKFQNRSIGFAAQHFISEFYALRSILHERKLITTISRPLNFSLYLSPCLKSIHQLNRLEKFLKDNKLNELNRHFNFKHKKMSLKTPINALVFIPQNLANKAKIKKAGLSLIPATEWQSKLFKTIILKHQKLTCSTTKAPGRQKL